MPPEPPGTLPSPRMRRTWAPPARARPLQPLTRTRRLHRARALCPAPHAQDMGVVNAIASYFQHPIPEVPWNDEDAFISVLNKAGLTDQTV